MSAAIAPRNRLAKSLPQEWRQFLLAQGVPKRKYIAVCWARLADGRELDELIVEEGWIISTSRTQMAGQFEQRIDFDPRIIAELQLLQVA
ncbi:MAG TPA: hypothetical protein VL992_16385 [Tepidisphaeraceae bacterium]|nr:hypothetical protein [Tepidisphaeraceae bacterium]